VTAFRENLNAIVEMLQANGKQPIIARIPYSSHPTNVPNASVQDLNGVINAVTAHYDLPVGPNLYAHFQANQGELSDDMVHLNTAGNASMNRLWAEVAANLSVDDPGGRADDYIQRAYIAFFNRPADVPGLNYWMNYPGNMQDLLTEFAKSEEYLSDFAGMNNSQILTIVYQNLFGRAPDGEGLTYWSTQMSAGHITIANVAYEVLGGARNEDAEIIKNKTLAANAFTSALDTQQKVDAYNNAGPNGLGNEAKNWLAAVNEYTATVEAAVAKLDALLNTLVTGK